MDRACDALFPSPGAFRVIVEVTWDLDEVEVGVTGITNIMVTAPVDEAHANAALKILSTPDVLLTLALGGDHLPEGREALRTALDNPVLRPHFAIVEAKRLGNRFRTRHADVEAACKLLDDENNASHARSMGPSWDDSLA